MVGAAQDAFARLHEGLAQQGPGSDRSTARALGLVRDLPPRPEILDLGAGPGRQTLALARQTQGRVTAVDVDAGFLGALRRRAASEGLGARVRTLTASMDGLDLAPGTFDLVWSEGAAYQIGFDRALALWRPWLRVGGGLAVTELAWLAAEPPADARRFWEGAYPAMRSRAANRAAIERAGFELAGDFALPASDWWEGYYAELEPRIAPLRARFAASPEAQAVLDAAAEEIDLFRRSDGAYGYVFYVATRSERPGPAPAGSPSQP
jgi:serine/threonine-protein kinase HipA